MQKREGSNQELPSIITASYRGDVEGIARLLDSGADVNSVDPRDNLTPLHIACLQGDRLLVEFLVKRHQSHGDVDFTIRSNAHPRLAWQYAANRGYWDLAELVDDAGLAKAGRMASKLHPKI